MTTRRYDLEPNWSRANGVARYNIRCGPDLIAQNMILTDAARVVDLLNMSEMLRENARTPQRELEVIQQRS
jgi:hypothetical protein